MKPASLYNNDFADKIYEEQIRDGALQDYKILHLSDLWVDLKYVPGAKTQCREFRCCHAD